MYFIVTPAKNEEENLPSTIRSIERQTIKPILWVIVDDGSTDSTPQIIESAKKKHEWIHSIHLNESARDLTIHCASVYKIGLDSGIKYCEGNKMEYEYIATVDADINLENTYFENLIKEFEKNPNLGIASGETWSIVGDRVMPAKQRENLPSGGHRLWRKKCFEETGGFLLTHSWDSVLNVKAALRGWKVKRFEEYKAIQRRMTSSAEGLWKGWRIRGESAYYLDFHPLYVVARAIRYLFEKPYYIGLAYLVGYVNSYINRKEKSDDEEIRNYYRYTRPQEIKKFYLNRFKKLFIKL